MNYNYLKLKELSLEQLYKVLTYGPLNAAVKEGIEQRVERFFLSRLNISGDTLSMPPLEGLMYVSLAYDEVEKFWDAVRAVQHEFSIFTAKEFYEMGDAYDDCESIQDIPDVSDVFVDEVIDQFEYKVEAGLNNAIRREADIGEDFESMYLYYIENEDMFEDFYFDRSTGKIYTTKMIEL